MIKIKEKEFEKEVVKILKNMDYKVSKTKFCDKLIEKNGKKISVEIKVNGSSISLPIAIGQLYSSKVMSKIDDMWLIINKIKSSIYWNVFKNNGIKIFQVKDNSLHRINVEDIPKAWRKGRGKKSKKKMELLSKIERKILSRKEKFCPYDIVKDLLGDKKDRISQSTWNTTYVYVGDVIKSLIKDGKLKEIGWFKSKAPIQKKMYEVKK